MSLLFFLPFLTAAAEDDAAYRSSRFTMMAVPVDLVPAVQKLIAKRAG